MSDEEATKKEKEEAEATKKAEEVKKRLWIVHLVCDPDSGQTVIMLVQNVKKQWQLDMMLGQATEQQTITKNARAVVELLKGIGVVKEKKKGLFRG